MMIGEFYVGCVLVSIGFWSIWRLGLRVWVVGIALGLVWDRFLTELGVAERMLEVVHIVLMRGARERNSFFT